MVALSSAKRQLRKNLSKSKHLVEAEQFKPLFVRDPTFDPFKVEYWIRNESDEQAICEGYYPDLFTGLTWCAFFPTVMRHTRAPFLGEPFYLLPWQRDDLAMPLLAWRNPRGYNRVRKADAFVAKKNGKTTFCTGVIAGVSEMGGVNLEMYGTAFTKEQAGKLYRDTTTAFELSPLLKGRYKTNDSRKRFVHRRTNSFYQVLAGENGSRGNDGIDPTLVVLDEIHQMRDRALYDILDGAGMARDWYLFLSVSTVGVIDPSLIWQERYEYAKDWLRGKHIDLAYFAYVAQADEICATSAEARRDPKQILKANPSIKLTPKSPGTIPIENFLQQVTETENNPAKLHQLLRFHYNIPVARSAAKAIPADSWANCQFKGSLLEYLLRGETYVDSEGIIRTRRRRCYAGMDMASNEDLTAVSYFFPMTPGERENVSEETIEKLQFHPQGIPVEMHDAEGEPIEPEHDGLVEIPPGYLLHFIFCPAAKILERERNNDSRYQRWADEKYLIKSPGRRLRHSIVTKNLLWAVKTFEVLELGYDPWNAEAVVQSLEDKTDLAIIEVAQTFKGMSLGVSSFLTLIIEEALLHDGNPAAAWCAGNAAAGWNDDAVKWYKDQSSDKIDPIVADSIAVGRAVVGASEYNDHDVAGYFDETDNSLNRGTFL